MTVSLCALCGTRIGSDAGLCGYHDAPFDGDWAVSNRIMCDFFHRGREPRRLAVAERERPPWVSNEVDVSSSR